MIAVGSIFADFGSVQRPIVSDVVLVQPDASVVIIRKYVIIVYPIERVIVGSRRFLLTQEV